MFREFTHFFIHFRDLSELKNTLSEMVTAIVEEFLQPDVNKLIPRSS